MIVRVSRVYRPFYLAPANMQHIINYKAEPINSVDTRLDEDFIDFTRSHAEDDILKGESIECFGDKRHRLVHE